MPIEDSNQPEDNLDNRFFQPKIFKQDTVAEIPQMDSVDSFSDIGSEEPAEDHDFDRGESKISDNLNFSNENQEHSSGEPYYQARRPKRGLMRNKFSMDNFNIDPHVDTNSEFSNMNSHVSEFEFMGKRGAVFGSIHDFGALSRQQSVQGSEMQPRRKISSYKYEHDEMSDLERNSDG